MFWFWQTRQRSSSDRPCRRFSATGSAARAASVVLEAIAAVDPRKVAKTKARLRPRIVHLFKLRQQRHDLVAEHVRADRSGVLHADDAGLVDDVGFRHAIDAVVDADAAVEVHHGQLVRVAVLAEPGVGALEGEFFLFLGAHLAHVEAAVAAHFLVVEADQRHVDLLREVDEDRVLGAAGNAPRGPDVEQPDLALHVLGAERLVRRRQDGQVEGRGRLADQRRRHVARVEAEADGEQGDEGGKAAQYPEIAVHACWVPAGVLTGDEVRALTR